MANNDVVPGFDDAEAGEQEQEEGIKIVLKPVEDLPHCLIINLSGYIDTYNSRAFQKKINLAMEAGFTQLVFNCGELNYVSSTGIGAFTAFLKREKTHDGDVVLTALQPSVAEVFQLLGFSQFFTIKENVDVALDGFRQLIAQVKKTFPCIITCPVCKKKLKAEKPGRFRCYDCKSVLTIDAGGQVALG
jgi:anti-anti-sigma factor